MQPPTEATAYDLLARLARAAPRRPAVIDRGATTSYGELYERATGLASGLAAEGIGETRIGLICNNRLAWLEVYFASSALGAQLVPISTWSTAAELDFILGDCAVGCLIAIPELGGQDFVASVEASEAVRSGALRKLVLIDGPARPGWLLLDEFRRKTHPALPEQRGTPGVILYTSGSSSRPKAVPLLDATALRNGFDIGERQGLGPEDRVLISIPLFWSYGAVNALPAVITHGGALVLQSRFEPGGALDLIEQHGCTALYTLPAMTSALIAHPAFARARTRSLRTGLTIGSPQDVVRTANALGAAEICNVYGSTETYGNCCVTPHDWPLERRAGCQGPPLPGMRLRIRDGRTGALSAPGEIGQIEVAGYLTSGYAFDSARHNGDVFTPDGWFRSGDLGALQADGTLVYAGRSSEMIKRSGINVSPAEVEEVLQQHADVALAGVTGHPDPVRGEIIVAFVVPRAGAAIGADQLRAHCRERLSSYKLPDHVEIRAALPLTVTGKLMRRELKALAADCVPKRP